MHSSTDWTLLGKILANEATDVERKRFDDWLAIHPDQKPLVDELRQIWRKPKGTTATSAQDVANAFERLQQRIDVEQRPDQSVGRSRWRWPIRPVIQRSSATKKRRTSLTWAITAPLSVALLVIGWYQFHHYWEYEPLLQQINPKGSRSLIKLSDGTTVWLNADSHLTYPKSFQGHLREVALEGEAFFQVTPNPKKPFVVTLKTGSVRVLGTSFNIRAYPSDTTVETSVLTGRVAFIPHRKQLKPALPLREPSLEQATDTIFLTPNVKAVQVLTRQRVDVQSTVAAHQVAWTQARLMFRDTPMGEVAKTLERWYGTPVRLEQESIRHCRLTGTFQNQSLPEVMAIIAMTNRFDYELTNSRLLIKGAGCNGY